MFPEINLEKKSFNSNVNEICYPLFFAFCCQKCLDLYINGIFILNEIYIFVICNKIKISFQIDKEVTAQSGHLIEFITEIPELI